MAEGRFSYLLLCCENSINQYPGQKTLTDVWGESSLLYRSCFRDVVLPCRLRMLLYVFVKK